MIADVSQMFAGVKNGINLPEPIHLVLTMDVSQAFAEIAGRRSSHGSDKDFLPSPLALGEGGSNLTCTRSTERMSECDSAMNMTRLTCFLLGTRWRHKLTLQLD